MATGGRRVGDDGLQAGGGGDLGPPGVEPHPDGDLAVLVGPVLDDATGHLGAELLIAATMRPHGRAKVFRDCARFGFLNAKMHNLPLFHLFWVSFQFLCWFLGHLVCAKLLNGNIGRAKKFAFRRSGVTLPKKRSLLLPTSLSPVFSLNCAVFAAPTMETSKETLMSLLLSVPLLTY